MDIWAPHPHMDPETKVRGSYEVQPQLQSAAPASTSRWRHAGSDDTFFCICQHKSSTICHTLNRTLDKVSFIGMCWETESHVGTYMMQYLSLNWSFQWLDASNGRTFPCFRTPNGRIFNFHRARTHSFRQSTLWRWKRCCFQGSTWPRSPYDRLLSIRRHPHRCGIFWTHVRGNRLRRW